MYYLAHGSRTEGMGHLYRCAALALSSGDAAPILLTRSADLARSVWPQVGEIRTTTYHVQDILPQLTPGSVIVVDSYDVEDSLCRALEHAGHSVIRLDDYARGPLTASVVLNHAAEPDDYRRQIAPWSRAFTGLPYAAVRPAFRDRAQAHDGSALHHAVVCLGGADPHNLTRACVQALASWGLPRITVVVGTAWSHSLDDLRALHCEPQLHIERQLDERAMVDLMDSCALVLCSASTVAIEACCRLRPCIAVQYADNQARLAQYLTRHGLAHVIGPEQIAALTAVPLSAAQRRDMVQAQQRTAGTSSHLPQLTGYAHALASLTIRRATAEDSAQVLAWANEPAVRRYSISSHAIDADDHRRWYAGTMQRDRRTLLIAMQGDTPAGYVRLEHPSQDQPQAYTVSIALDPAIRGRGMATPVLAAGLRHFCLYERDPDTSPLPFMALIHPDNQASRRLFASLGFAHTGNRTLNATSFMTYEK